MSFSVSPSCSPCPSTSTSLPNAEEDTEPDEEEDGEEERKDEDLSTTSKAPLTASTHFSQFSTDRDCGNYPVSEASDSDTYSILGSESESDESEETPHEEASWSMFPRRWMRRPVEMEADEERMMDWLPFDIEPDSLPPRNTKSAGATVLRGVLFDDGSRLFMQYYFILKKRDQYDGAEEILQHIMASSAYQPRDRQSAIRIVLITSSTCDPTSSNKPANS
ncbi:hypothetical protein BJ165DRAFT_1530836 [Panaeolus papilionaceus]|nr:hypothetical protein BJ165DRAFT_1530836 [Panaeolus papilionaceus]